MKTKKTTNNQTEEQTMKNTATATTEKEYECQSCGANHLTYKNEEIYCTKEMTIRCNTCGGITKEMTGDNLVIDGDDGFPTEDEVEDGKLTERGMAQKIAYLLEDGEECRIETLKDAGYLTNDTGLEVRINGQVFIITIQEGRN
jgi:hypothetical protein